MPALTASNSNSNPQTGFDTKTKDDFPAIPPGTYDAEVARIEYRTKEDVLKKREETGKGFWPDWKTYDAEIAIGFRITNGEYKGRWFFGDTEADFSMGSKLRIWVSQLLGFKIPDDFVFDTDELEDYEGLDCRIKLKRFTNKKGVEKNSIVEVLSSEGANYDDADGIF
jgi:hypothetical protein